MDRRDERAIHTRRGPPTKASSTRTGRVLVANRTTATVSVVDPRKGAVVKTVTTGANPNHVTVVHGTAFVLAKSGSGPAGGDEVYRFRVTR
ncbi:hypothetical protein [Streptomyces noursei]|uniref:hypothetical protein n=1 Tax=Streptomyces noursei TaxID=1971 RepID=UPI0005CB5CF9|nr:hypothetical protein [Streptomyces noursei]